MTDLDAWIPLAEIARPHGVRGELRLKLFNESSDVLLSQDEVLVRLRNGEEHEVSVERARRADDAILMKLFSIDDRNRADEFRGAFICVRRREFPPAEEGEFYTVDIIGAEARFNGERLGEVIEIMTYPTLQALLVRAEDGKGNWEIPLTETYVGKLDTSARLVELLSLDDLERLPVKKPKTPKPKRGSRNDSSAAGADVASETGAGSAEATDEDEGDPVPEANASAEDDDALRDEG